MINERLAARFWKYVSTKPSNEIGCWQWTGAMGRKGYGEIYGGKPKQQWRAHRLSWTMHRGEIPPGLFVLHKCDNPKCVNPEHLFLGDARANYHDSRGKRRHAHGEAHGSARLDAATVNQIRDEYERGGISQLALAKKYGIGQTAVGQLIRRQTWRSIQENPSKLDAKIKQLVSTHRWFNETLGVWDYNMEAALRELAEWLLGV